MENLNLMIANKIKTLRKANNLTQNELAEKINYSNKAVSRWETGEVIPDVATLNSICEVFNISLASMFEEEVEIVEPEKKSKLKISNKLAISLLAILGIWIITTVIYCMAYFFKGYNWWQLFIMAVPLSCVIGVIFNSIWGKGQLNSLIITTMLWSTLTTVYLILLEFNVWYIYFIGIPVQIAILLFASISKNIQDKKKAKKLKDKIKATEKAKQNADDKINVVEKKIKNTDDKINENN